MTPTIRLGRLFGIEIGFNWSLVFIFVLITWTLATSVFPQDVRGQTSVAYWGVAIIGALGFYACLLAHELAHALVAVRQGVKVAGITLWLFGGVSRLESEPRSGRSEALITVVGPLTSLVVAVIAYLAATISAAASAPGLVTDLFSWLGYLNLALALFNLVPAFPLDGGRLLSSILWWRTGSRRRGIHLAVAVGRVFAYLMIAVGLLELFAGYLVDGVWIAFIGWFLLSAAGAEESGVEASTLLRSVPVSAAMSSPVVTFPDWLTVEYFLASVAPTHHNFGTYPLRDPQDRLTGVVRLGELLRRMRTGDAERRLGDLAIPIAEMPRANPQEDLSAVLERVGRRLDQRVLVFEGSQLAGILSPADVARLLTLRRAAADHRPNKAG